MMRMRSSARARYHSSVDASTRKRKRRTVGGESRQWRQSSVDADGVQGGLGDLCEGGGPEYGGRNVLVRDRPSQRKLRHCSTARKGTAFSEEMRKTQAKGRVYVCSIRTVVTAAVQQAAARQQHLAMARGTARAVAHSTV